MAAMLLLTLFMSGSLAQDRSKCCTPEKWEAYGEATVGAAAHGNTDAVVVRSVHTRNGITKSTGRATNKCGVTYLF